MFCNIHWTCLLLGRTLRSVKTRQQTESIVIDTAQLRFSAPELRFFARSLADNDFNPALASVSAFGQTAWLNERSMSTARFLYVRLFPNMTSSVRFRDRSLQEFVLKTVKVHLWSLL